MRCTQSRWSAAGQDLFGVPLIMAEQIPRSERPSAAQNFALKTVLGITRRTGDGFLLDLGHMEAMAPRKGLLRSGGRAHFVVDGDELKTIYVEQDGNRHEPGRAGWDLVEKRFLAGLNGHMTFVEHLLYCHMVVGNSYVVATLEALPSRHELRSLLQPFVIETLRVNNDNVDGLIKSEHSNVPAYTGYPLSVLNNATKTMALGFDFRMMDPEWRARE